MTTLHPLYRSMYETRIAIAELLAPAYAALNYETTPAYYKLCRIHEYARQALHC